MLEYVVGSAKMIFIILLIVMMVILSAMNRTLNPPYFYTLDCLHPWTPTNAEVNSKEICVLSEATRNKV